MSVKSKPFSDPARWVCLYPIYINSLKKLEEGRRIPKDKAVPDPTAQEIFDVLHHAGLHVELNQSTMHPRDPNREPGARGRVRVQLRNDDGTPSDLKFQTRKDLMLYVADLIPKLKSRLSELAAPGPSQSTGTSGKKKKR